MKRLLTALTPLLLMMALLSPVTMAQETTDQPEPTPTQETTQELIATVAPTQVTPPASTPTDTPSSETDYLLTIIGSIFLTIVVGGSLFIGYQGLKIAGISVPQEVQININDQAIKLMQTTMEQVGKYVQSTPSPIDDAIYSAGRIPVEALIEELSKRPLSPEQSLKAYQALQQTLDDTSLGQGYGTNDPTGKK